MPRYSLFIKARFCPEVMERVLRVIRHRGFKLCALNMLLCGKSVDEQIKLSLVVDSNRAIRLLHKQLDKLMDINYIEIK